MSERTAVVDDAGAAKQADEHAPRQEGRASPVVRAAALLAILLVAPGTRVAMAGPGDRAEHATVHEGPGSPHSSVTNDVRRDAPTAASTRGNAHAAPARAPVTRIDAIEQAGDELLEVVRHAHRGNLPQGKLRAARLGVERRLSRTLAAMPADLRSSDRARFDRAVARLNQIIIRSQEWEAFGPRPRPEWGWDPQREIRALETGEAALDAGDVVIVDAR